MRNKKNKFIKKGEDKNYKFSRFVIFTVIILNIFNRYFIDYLNLGISCIFFVDLKIL